MKSLSCPVISGLCIAVLGLSAASAQAQQAGDPAAGAAVFKKCLACHNVETDKAKIGPSLKGVIGRQPGTMTGFSYSSAMKGFGEGKLWDDALLAEYLHDPRAIVKGTKMAFAGLKKDQEIADVIAYLKTFGPGQ